MLPARLLKIAPALTLSLALLAVHARAERRILFMAGDKGDNQLFTMGTNGEAVTQLTTGVPGKWAPALEPESLAVAFVDQTAAVSNLYVMTLALPTVPQRLPITGKALAVQWQDRNTLCYLRDVPSGGFLPAYELWSIRTDGTGETQVYTNTFTTWPLGTQGFHVDRTQGRVYLASMLAGGSSPSLLQSGALGATAPDLVHPVQAPLDGRSDHYNPAASPDGAALAYCADYGGGEHRLYVGPNGKADAATLACETFCGSPAWAPDSAWIAFARAAASTFGGNAYVGDICRVNPDGGSLTNLTLQHAALTGTCGFPTVFDVAAPEPPTPPKVANAPASNVLTETSADLYGFLSATGSAATVTSIYWGEADGVTNPTGWQHEEMVGPSEPGFFHARVAIAPNKPYWYRCRANNGLDAWASESLLFGTATPAPVPFLETFEPDAPGAMAGTPGPIHYQNGWLSAPPTAVIVQAEEVYSGKQAAALPSGTLSHDFTGTPTNAWLEIYARPQPMDYPTGIVDSATAVFWLTPQSRLAAFDGASAVTIPDPLIALGAWVRFVVNCDYVRQRWSLWVNGTNVVYNFRMYSARPPAGLTGLSIRNSGDASCLLDDVRADVLSPGALLTDADLDWLPDTWEREHFGNSLVRANGATDQDRDGQKDRGEFIADTDPNDAASLLAIADVRSPSPTNVVLSFFSVTNRDYLVDSCSDTMTRVWSDLLSNAVPGQAGRTTVTGKVDQAGSRRFFRVRTQLR